MVGLAALTRDRGAGQFRKMLWLRARRVPRGRPCPHCHQTMEMADVPAGSRTLELDLCRHCFGVWFDPSEFEALPRDGRPDRQAMKPATLEAMATSQMDRAQLRRLGESRPAESGPAWWKYIPAVFGCPVEIDAPPLAARPLVTWGLAGLLTIVFLLTRANLDSVVQSLGFKPALWARAGGLTLLTSFLLHGGWMHLLGNLYFLLVFGDNVEDRLGRVRYLVLVVASHLAGTALHGALDPHGEIPCIGASGGIFGLVAFYSLTFPKTRMGLLFFFRLVQVPAWFLLLFYLALQLLGAFAQVSGFSSVSNLGHLGGIGVGVAAAMLCRASPPGGDAHTEERGRRGEYAPRQIRLD